MPRDHDLAPLLTALDGRLSMLAQVVREMFDASTLAVETWVFPASGIIERSWHVEFHAVAVTNLSTHPVTVTSSTAQTAAPTQGPGMAIVPGGGLGAAVHNLAGHTLTVYGTAGDTVVIEAYARPQNPAWG